MHGYYNTRHGSTKIKLVGLNQVMFLGILRYFEVTIDFIGMSLSTHKR